jgi:opacity protein-like surface antigen
MRFPLRACIVLASLLPLASVAAAQTITPLQKQLNHMDLSLNGMGSFSHTVSGPVLPAFASDSGQQLVITPSNTFGALVNLRYIAKPYIGFEFNYTFARYTQNYTTTGASPAPGGIQTNVNEYTLGYVVTPPHPIFGMQPYASAGTGTIEFKPTSAGGQELLRQGRQGYYYNLGLQDPLYSSVSLRAGFRQTFYLAPDLGQNYLTILKHTYTVEPYIGIDFKF